MSEITWTLKISNIAYAFCLERARSIQEINDHDSIVARRLSATDFSNTIDPNPTFANLGAQSPYCALAPAAGEDET